MRKQFQLVLCVLLTLNLLVTAGVVVYLGRVAAIRRIVPDCGLTTDIFSGYCSETEEASAKTPPLERKSFS